MRAAFFCIKKICIFSLHMHKKRCALFNIYEVPKCLFLAETFLHGSEVCNVGVQRNKKIIHFTSRLYDIISILRVDLMIYSIK